MLKIGECMTKLWPFKFLGIVDTKASVSITAKRSLLIEQVWMHVGMQICIVTIYNTLFHLRCVSFRHRLWNADGGLQRQKISPVVFNWTVYLCADGRKWNSQKITSKPKFPRPPMYFNVNRLINKIIRSCNSPPAICCPRRRKRSLGYRCRQV